MYPQPHVVHGLALPSGTGCAQRLPEVQPEQCEGQAAGATLARAQPQAQPSPARPPGQHPEAPAPLSPARTIALRWKCRPRRGMRLSSKVVGTRPARRQPPLTSPQRAGSLRRPSPTPPRPPAPRARGWGRGRPSPALPGREANVGCFFFFFSIRNV